MTEPEALHEIEIESLAAGGDGVGRLEGQAVFVPGAVPGDRLRIRLTARKARWARAEIDAVLSPGPQRCEPPCPVAGDCGGCQWQQVAAEGQRAARRAVVVDALTRIGGLADCPEPDFAPSPADLGYRRRAEYRLLAKGGGEMRIGFLAPASHRVVDHERCLLLEPPLATAVSDLRAHLAGRLGRVCSALLEFTLLAGDAIQLVATLDPAARRELAPALADWRPADFPVHLALRDEEGRLLREAPGAPFLLETVQIALSDGRRVDHELYTRPGEFVQGNRAANRQLVTALLERFDATGDPWVLDLFCGAGNFTLPLAQLGGKVLGVETRRGALRSARKSARRAGIGRARFRAGAVGELLPVLAAEGRGYRTLVLDPPRQGAPEVAAQLAPLDVQEILAVSCHPASFARDLRAWVDAGFALESVELFDFFPQTHHVELLARLVRG